MNNKKLIIGTANFSNHYGTFNQTNVSKLELDKIFKYLEKSKINFLDTAISYKGCDKVLGRYNLKKFNIISKIINYPETNLTQDFLVNKFKQSLDNLKLDRIYSMLLHNPTNSLSLDSNIYYDFLNYLKNKSIIKKIGISVYSPEELEFCLNKIEPDLVQIPINIFDNRFIKSGLIDKLKSKNIEIHGRSIFLQGILARNIWPKYFNPWKNKVEDFQHELNKIEISSTQACISYVNGIKYLDGIILGIDTLNQLKQYMDMLKLNINLDYFLKKFSIDDEKFVNPSMWTK